MTPHRVVYVINQSPGLKRAWRELTQSQKRAVVRECETEEEEAAEELEAELEKIIEEIACGQRRLF